VLQTQASSVWTFASAWLWFRKSKFKAFLQGNNVENKQSNNPLHGMTLEMMLSQLVEHYGWDKMGQVIDIRCFTHDPSIKSSLKFLRKTPWARTKVENLYLTYIRETLA
jgi:uncharacterized protein (DUF2132 family)